jgi:hypothetical protein
VHVCTLTLTGGRLLAVAFTALYFFMNYESPADFLEFWDKLEIDNVSNFFTHQKIQITASSGERSAKSFTFW